MSEIQRENHAWSRSQDNYYPTNVKDVIDTLPVGVYKVCFDERTNSCLLQFVEEKFQFDYKVYGVERKFVNRVIKSFNEVKNNLGVLLNGVKGTGKSVTAKIICNELDLPVIIIDKSYDGKEIDLLGSIKQECIIFVDEYEKVYIQDDEYGNDNPKILTMMDGVLSANYKRLFLFTTNDSFINRNLLQRPGRIRYKKEFSDLSLEAVNEVINDSLIDKSFQVDLINVLKTLDIITIDIVKALVSEINIHNEPASSFVEDFNVKIKEETLSLYKVSDIAGVADLLIVEEFNPRHVTKGSFIYSDELNENIGPITEVVSPVYPQKYIITTNKVETVYKVKKNNVHHRIFTKGLA